MLFPDQVETPAVAEQNIIMKWGICASRAGITDTSMTES